MTNKISVLTKALYLLLGNSIFCVVFELLSKKFVRIRWRLPVSIQSSCDSITSNMLKRKLCLLGSRFRDFTLDL